MEISFDQVDYNLAKIIFTDYKPIATFNYFGVLGQAFNPTDDGDTVWVEPYITQLAEVGSNFTLLPEGHKLITQNCEQGQNAEYFNMEMFYPLKTGSMFVHTPEEYMNNMPTSFFGNNANMLDNPTQLSFYIVAQTTAWTTHLGGFSVGWTYTMPHSPDMSMTYSVEYEGYDTITTKAGATLTNNNWQNPYTMNYEPYHLWTQWDNSKGIYVPESYSGRRVWNLKFSYLGRLDTFPTEKGAGVTSAKWSDNEGMYVYNITDDPNERQVIGVKNDFYTRVIHGTRGGSLPFIFQPDKDIEEFALCRFDQNSFRFTQQAPDLYEVSVKIVESW